MAIRIITCNVNGIRSAVNKGFIDWLSAQNADFVCLQELRASREKLPEAFTKLTGYFSTYHFAERPGYSGVAVLSRYKPKRVVIGLDWPEMDREGRCVRIDVGDLSVVSLYVPSGSSSETRQAVKDVFLTRYPATLENYQREKRQFVICGDINIAHKEIDLKNWRSNQKNSGFLPHERAWMDRLFSDYGFVDAFRLINQGPEQYTWWSNRGQAWAKNVGWRIDYHIATPQVAQKAKAATIYRETRFSDHAPLIMDYDLDLNDNA